MHCRDNATRRSRFSLESFPPDCTGHCCSVAELRLSRVQQVLAPTGARYPAWASAVEVWPCVSVCVLLWMCESKSEY